MGNNDEVFKLSNGTLWQVKFEYEYLYKYYPNVTICPSHNILIIAGKKLNVVNLTGASISSGPSIVESTVDGAFNGWDGKTIIVLTNGQIWEQAEYHYEYHYAYRPDVLIYKTGDRYMMQIEGTDEAVRVNRIN